MKKLFLFCVPLLLVAFMALPAGANSGHVFTSQTCESGWTASVTLDSNVTPDHFVEVTSTIPGTTGIVDGHYDTKGKSGTTLIWSESGPAPAIGTVTLTTLNANRTPDFTASASLPIVTDCPVPSTTTTTAPPTTTTTVVPTTTTVIPPVTSTTTVGSTTTTSGPVDSTTTSTVPKTTTSGTGTTTTGTVPTTLGPPPQPPLPHTGSNPLPPAIFGGSSLLVGAVLAVRRRPRLV